MDERLQYSTPMMIERSAENARRNLQHITRLWIRTVHTLAVNFDNTQVRLMYGGRADVESSLLATGKL